MDKNSKEFKELQAKWYDKLKKKGFEDIEQDEVFLKSYASSGVLAGKNQGLPFEQVMTNREAKAEYYRMAGYFMYDHKFKNSLERQIWKDHADGASHRETTAKLNGKGIKCNRTGVLNIITKLRKLMLDMYRSKDEQV